MRSSLRVAELTASAVLASGAVKIGVSASNGRPRCTQFCLDEGRLLVPHRTGADRRVSRTLSTSSTGPIRANHTGVERLFRQTIVLNDLADEIRRPTIEV
jgi:hypothetical protein